MCEDDEQTGRRVVYYVSPCGTIEKLTPESLQGDQDYLKDMIHTKVYQRPEDGE